MATKTVLLFCAQALLAMCVSSQCLGSAFNGYIGNGLAFEAAAPWGGPLAAPWNAYAESPLAAAPFAELATGYGPAGLAASNGGGFRITSASPIIPTGVSMTSENAYEGPLAVTGAVPFLGAIALEGVLPTAGTGGVTYGCGNGNIAMVSEDITPAYGPYGYGPGIAAAELGYGYPGYGYEAGIAGPGYGYGYNRGCGCGAIY